MDTIKNILCFGNIYSVFDGIQDYIHTYCISYVSSDEILINVEFLSYDLIDKDLDFDEIYYEKIKENIAEVLISECIKLKMNKIKINTSLRFMKQYTKLQRKIVIKKNEVKSTSYF